MTLLVYLDNPLSQLNTQALQIRFGLRQLLFLVVDGGRGLSQLLRDIVVFLNGRTKLVVQFVYALPEGFRLALGFRDRRRFSPN